MSEIRELVGLLNRLEVDSDVVYLGVAGVVLALVAVVVMARRARRYGLARVATNVVVLIVLSTTIEGAWKFAEHIGANGLDKVFPAVVFEAVGFKIYSMAREYAERFGKGPGRYGRRLYALGAVAGLIVASAGSNVGEVVFRVAMPLLAAWLVCMELEPLTEDAPQSATSWRWTPRRIGIELGLIVPGEQDAESIDRDRMVRRMTRLRFRIAQGGRGTDRRTTRYQAMALVADDAVLAEVRQRMTRAVNVMALTAPAALPAAGVVGVAPGSVEPGVDAPPDPGRASVQPDVSTPAVPVRSGQVTPDCDPGQPRSGNAEIVRRAAEANPGASVNELAQLTRLSPSTVKRYRPGGSPTGQPAAQTPGPAEPAKRLNGEPVPTELAVRF